MTIEAQVEKELKKKRSLLDQGTEKGRLLKELLDAAKKDPGYGHTTRKDSQRILSKAKALVNNRKKSKAAKAARKIQRKKG